MRKRLKNNLKGAVIMAAASAAGFLFIKNVFDELVEVAEEIWLAKLFSSAGFAPEETVAVIATLKKYKEDGRLYD